MEEPLQKGERPFESGTSAKNTTKQRKELIVSPTSPEDGSKSNDNGTEAASQRSGRKTVEEEMLPDFSTSSIGERYYSTLPHFTLLYFALLHFTFLYFSLLYFTLLYFSLLYFSLVYFTLIYIALLYFAFLYLSLLCFTLLCLTLL